MYSLLRSRSNSFLKCVNVLKRNSVDISEKKNLQFSSYQNSLRVFSTSAGDDDQEYVNCKFVKMFEEYGGCAWSTRKIMNDLAGMDMVISPPIFVAGLKACRRLNDIALAIRWLETIREKCVGDESFYTYIMCETGDEMNCLGVPSLEELKYLEPELWLESVYDMDGPKIKDPCKNT